jgi:conjugal transfer ATP-binding protein TraC
MISGVSGYAVGRLILDPFSALLYSTKAEDYAALKAIKDQGMSMEEAINMLSEQRKLAA